MRAADPQRHPKVLAIEGVAFALSRAARSRNLVAALFRDGHAPYTALLWAMNLLNLLSNFLILLWTPAILHSSGAIPSQAIFATSMFGLGIILGALLTASVADRLGVEQVLTYTVAFGALCVLSIGLLEPRFSALSVIICGAGVGIGDARLVSSPYREGFILHISARPEPVGPWAWGVSAPLLGRSWAAYCSGSVFRRRSSSSRPRFRSLPWRC